MTAYPLGLTEGEAVLLVCAHPDDETLGAGGTIHRLASSGITVHVLAGLLLPRIRPGNAQRYRDQSKRVRDSLRCPRRGRPPDRLGRR